MASPTLYMPEVPTSSTMTTFRVPEFIVATLPQFSETIAPTIDASETRQTRKRKREDEEEVTESDERPPSKRPRLDVARDTLGTLEEGKITEKIIAPEPAVVSPAAGATHVSVAVTRGLKRKFEEIEENSDEDGRRKRIRVSEPQPEEDEGSDDTTSATEEVGARGTKRKFDEVEEDGEQSEADDVGRKRTKLVSDAPAEPKNPEGEAMSTAKVRRQHRRRLPRPNPQLLALACDLETHEPRKQRRNNVWVRACRHRVDATVMAWGQGALCINVHEQALRCSRSEIQMCDHMLGAIAYNSVQAAEAAIAEEDADAVQQEAEEDVFLQDSVQETREPSDAERAQHADSIYSSSSEDESDESDEDTSGAPKDKCVSGHKFFSEESIVDDDGNVFYMAYDADLSDTEVSDEESQETADDATLVEDSTAFSPEQNESVNDNSDNETDEDSDVSDWDAVPIPDDPTLVSSERSLHSDSKADSDNEEDEEYEGFALPHLADIPAWNIDGESDVMYAEELEELLRESPGTPGVLNPERRGQLEWAQPPLPGVWMTTPSAPPMPARESPRPPFRIDENGNHIPFLLYPSSLRREIDFNADEEEEFSYEEEEEWERASTSSDEEGLDNGEDTDSEDEKDRHLLQMSKKSRTTSTSGAYFKATTPKRLNS
ncbi:hypothetical protein CERSUDRAFT_126120 [Gelatoporia subvermispora B]|uniref:Uncharacterized protein n=1 Tax=Ceriporiopsis subvermispora (strain B) TaxID=914234 RepID=M2R372_CERS8|nr:hypothetical protein CERSUDRAFT_126120 [Gelatoporia subvermispora B]